MFAATAVLFDPRRFGPAIWSLGERSWTVGAHETSSTNLGENDLFTRFAVREDRSRPVDSPSPSWEVYVTAVDSQTHQRLEFAFGQGRVRFMPTVQHVQGRSPQPVVVVRGDVPTLASTLGSIRSWTKGLPIVAIGDTSDRSWARAALLEGAIAIIDSAEQPTDLTARIADVAAGVAVLPGWLSKELGDEVRCGVKLRPLERAVLMALEDGKTLREAAEELNYSERQLQRVIAGLRERLGISARTALVGEARRRGMI